MKESYSEGVANHAGLGSYAIVRKGGGGTLIEVRTGRVLSREISLKSGRRRPPGKPETFNFLGFTHCCGQTRQGKFTVIRQTMRQRMLKKLKALSEELRRRRHEPIPVQGGYVRAVVQGHINYYGVPFNSPALHAS